MKKFFWVLSIVSILGLASCDSGSSEEAKRLLTKILNLVGIPQTIVVNICQDENGDGVCGVLELQAEVTIKKGDSIATIWNKITNTAEGKYLLETYDATLPLLLELQDSSSEYYTDKFTIPFNGLKSTEEEKDLSILQAMVDAGHLSADDISAVKEMDNQEIFYETLLKNFEINLNTLTEQNLSSPRAVLANIKEIAEELKEAGIADELPKKIDGCEDNNSCVEESIEETIIDENESQVIQDNETKRTKELVAGKTFYMYDNESNSVQEVAFNAQADTFIMDGEIEPITIKGNKLLFNNDSDGSYTIITEATDYLVFTDYHADGTLSGDGHKLYFNQSDAEGERGGETAKPIGFTKEMLKDKVFYHYAFTEEDGSKVYGKMTIASETSWLRKEVIVSTDGEVVGNETFPVSYILEDGKIKSDAGSDYRYLTLNSQDDNAWYVTEEVDRGKDGIIDESSDDTLYLSKPADYPAEL
jgi:hypothetical protein